MAAGGKAVNTSPCELGALMLLRRQFRGLKRVAIAEGVLICLLVAWGFRSWLW